MATTLSPCGIEAAHRGAAARIERAWQGDYTAEWRLTQNVLTVRHYPGLVTPALLAWLRSFVCYDGDGRSSRWLVQGEPLPPELAAVAEAVCPGVDFFGVLLQAYRDGTATTPCHADAEGGFILSLGATRTFRVHRVTEGGDCGDDADAVRIECVNGTVLVMDEAFHAGWHHQLIADPDVAGERLGLVFRRGPARRGG